METRTSRVKREVSKNIGTPMKGIEISKLMASEHMQERGW